MDCLSGFVAGRHFGLAVGGFVSWSRKLAGHPFGFLVFLVLRHFVVLRVCGVCLAGWLLSPSGVCGWRRGGSGLSA